MPDDRRLVPAMAFACSFWSREYESLAAVPCHSPAQDAVVSVHESVGFGADPARPASALLMDLLRVDRWPHTSSCALDVCGLANG